MLQAGRLTKEWQRRRGLKMRKSAVDFINFYPGLIYKEKVTTGSQKAENGTGFKQNNQTASSLTQQ